MENQYPTPPPAQPATVFVENGAPEPMSVKNWVITLILTAIPLVGFIMLFVWAFGDNTNKTRSNWAKAALILMAICLVLYIVFIALFGAAMVADFSGNAFN